MTDSGSSTIGWCTLSALTSLFFPPTIQVCIMGPLVEGDGVSSTLALTSGVDHPKVHFTCFDIANNWLLEHFSIVLDVDIF